MTNLQTDYKIVLSSKTNGTIASIGIGEKELKGYSREIFGRNHSPTEREQIEVLLNVGCEKFNRGHVLIGAGNEE